MNRGIVGILLMLVATSIKATAQNDDVSKRLVKRYGYAYALGKAYVVRANSLYAFADSAGRIIGNFQYRKIDTVLPDRAIACTDENGNGCVLVNERGTIVTEGNYRPLRLVNRKRRLFAMGIGNGELLMNDMGRQLTYQTTDPERDTDALVQIGQYNEGAGLMTLNGDTLLPPIYGKVSKGARLYCGVKNDTAYVFQREKGLLFKLGKVHGCEILPNDFIVAEKYGAHALVSKRGKLLTDFKYYKIESLHYPYSIMPRSITGHVATPPSAPQYALITGGQPKGLIDSNGKEVLPIAYDELTMNRNGWFILRKALHDDEILTDSKLKEILKAGAYNITFVTDRYATVRTRIRNTGDDIVKTYDMVLRKFVNKEPEQPRERVSNAGSGYADPQQEIMTNYYNKDSMIINMAGTKLLHSGGRWGVVSKTGDTILPFVYDSAGSYGWRNYYVGKDGRFGKLNYEGELAMPAEMPELPWMVRSEDSMAFTGPHEPYSFKGGHIRKVDPSKEIVPGPLFRISYGGMTMTGGNKSYKYGLYNRQMKFLVEHPFSDVQRTGIVAITDSAGKNISIIDSNGKRLTPWIPKPLNFKMYEFGALFVNDSSKPDLLCRIDSGVARIDTVWLEKKWKKSWWRNDGMENIAFEKPGYGKGLVHNRNGKVFFIKGAEEIKTDDNYSMKVKIGDKWGMLDDKENQLLPFEYDSLKQAGNYFELVYKNGQVGIFKILNRKLIEPTYDSLGITDHFVLAYKEGKLYLINDSGKVFATNWEGMRLLHYSMLAGIPVMRNGVRYLLYPTLSDIIKEVPDTHLPDDIEPLRSEMDGTIIAKKANKVGVYDAAEKKWLVPAAYTRVEKEEDYFAAYSTGPESVTMYTPEGKKMFTLKGWYSPQREFEYNQWFMRGWNSAPVVNDAGRIIVPDTFDYVTELTYAGRHMYDVRTKKGKEGIIDTSGKVIVPVIYDQIEDHRFMYDGYFIAAIDGKICLMNPKGRPLTACKYKHVFEGYDREERMWGAGCSSRSMPVYPTDPADMHPYFIVSLEYDSKFGVIDSAGKELVACVYDSVKQVHLRKIAVAKKEDKWGLVSLTNKPVTEFKYDRIGIFYQGGAQFKRGEVIGRLRDDGTEEIFK